MNALRHPPQAIPDVEARRVITMCNVGRQQISLVREDQGNAPGLPLSRRTALLASAIDALMEAAFRIHGSESRLSSFPRQESMALVVRCLRSARQIGALNGSSQIRHRDLVNYFGSEGASNIIAIETEFAASCLGNSPIHEVSTDFDGILAQAEATLKESAERISILSVETSAARDAYLSPKRRPDLRIV